MAGNGQNGKRPGRRVRSAGKRAGTGERGGAQKRTRRASGRGRRARRRWCFSPADAASLASMLLGALAVMVLLSGGSLLPESWPDPVTLGTTLIIICLVLDGLDGALARLWGGSPLGLRMDSAADLVSFCLAPAALIPAAYLGSGGWDGAGTSIIVLCALASLLYAGAGGKRLIDFTRSGYALGRFRGLATPAAAFTAAVMVHVLPHNARLPWGLPGPHTQLLLLCLTAALMVAPLDYPKVRGRAGAAMALSLVGALAYLGLRKSVWPTFADELYDQYRLLSLMALGLALVYVVGGALYALALKDE